MSEFELPDNLISFGPDANCTLEICPIEWSVYQYRPSLPANAFFIAAFGLAMLIHAYLGIRWRQYFFGAFVSCGCIMAMVGYGGRIMLYMNPFSFQGFMIQVVCVTSGPVWFSAAIYVTLSKTIDYLAPELSRLNPKSFYWLFIAADLICLALQAAGGALSTTSSGTSTVGVDVAMAGLILQVIVLSIFSAAFIDFMVRYVRARGTAMPRGRVTVFFSALAFAVLLILGRSIFRCYELSQGYRDSDLITDEPLFIGLEGVLIVLAAYALCFGHPGFFAKTKTSLVSAAGSDNDDPTKQQMRQTSVV